MLSNPSKFLESARAESSEAVIRDLFGRCGITIDGSAPHDVQVHDRRFYTRALRDGNLGLGESYMDGWWDAEAVDQTVARLAAARLDKKVKGSPRALAAVLFARLVNLQALRAFEVGEKHYDIGNDLYEAMLDDRLVYTCAYWNDAADLAAAQEAKLDLVCRKIGAHEGMRILELGCGWGSFARFAAERYGCEVTGYTVSKAQVALGTERCKGLPVTLHLADYREARGTYDAVVSIGLMEHVGYKNYRSYFELVDRCLEPGGVAFVHTIAGNRSVSIIDPWFNKYIFPNAQLPSLTQIGAGIEDLFTIEDLHNIGEHYDHTLMAWHERFEATWPRFADRYGDRFYRMWRYYLLSCAGLFRARYCQLYQMVFTPWATPQPRDCRQS